MARIKRTQAEIEKDIELQTKVCCVCEERKPFDDFYNLKDKQDGKSYRCKVCDEGARKKWAKDNPEKQLKSQRRNNLRTKYGLSLRDYDEMLAKQGGVCAICGKDPKDNVVSTRVHRLSVDHNHETGKIRGLLCNQCNRGLGFLQDSSHLLRVAANYLDCH